MQETTSGGVQVQRAGGLKAWFGPLVIFGSMLVGVLVYMVVFGAKSNFVDNDPTKAVVSEGFGRWLGLIYKGGFLVPVAVGLLLTTITVSIERFITLSIAGGRGSVDVFVQKIKILLQNNDLNGAVEECDRQQGTVGNVIKEVLGKYREMENEKQMDKEQKILAIQKAQEEAISLELPMMERHLIILATIVSVATLVGLIGTVLGMIRAFAALANSGAPDSSALAEGISEALINTAFGISTSTIATVMYNYFTSKIDSMTYRIDESGFSIVQTFAEKHK